MQVRCQLQSSHVSIPTTQPEMLRFLTAKRIHSCLTQFQEARKENITKNHAV